MTILKHDQLYCLVQFLSICFGIENDFLRAHWRKIEEILIFSMAGRPGGHEWTYDRGAA